MKNAVKLFMTAAVLVAWPLTVTRAEAQFFTINNPNVGEKVKDFTLDTTTQDKVNFDKYRNGKKAIVFFWATWCPHCNDALPELDKKALEFESKGIKLILVDVGETREQVREHLKNKKLNFESFIDEHSKVAESYDIIGVPTFFFVDESGTIKDVRYSLPDRDADVFEKK